MLTADRTLNPLIATSRKAVKCSVIVPVYNSEFTLIELFNRINSLFQTLKVSYEVVFVDDSSQDNSWSIIKNLKEKFPKNIIAFKLNRNFGQHNALACGMAFSSGEFVVTIDDDLQIPPEEIEKLILNQRVTNADVVYGIYRSKQHSPVRNIGSLAIGALLKFNAGTNGKGSSFKLLKSDIAKNISTLNFSNLYIDEAITWYTSDISYVYVNHLPRLQGQSGYSFFKLVGTSINLLLNYTTFPLKVMTWGGFFSSVLFFLLGMYYIYDKFINDVQIGFTTLIVAIFFVASIMLLSLGIIGEYIRRLYTQHHNKPSFAIKEYLK